MIRYLGISIVALLAVEVSAANCPQASYTGFDTRLRPILLGRILTNNRLVVGFDVVAGSPVIAYPDGIMVFRDGTAARLPYEKTITGIAVDSESTIRIQDSDSISALGPQGLVRDEVLTARTKGRLLDSGNRAFLDLRQSDGTAEFHLIRPDGKELPLVSMPGRAATSAWSQAGLVAVIDDSLVSWEVSNADKFVRLLSDTGLHLAQSVCWVGHNRVVVGLPNAVVLVTPEVQTPLVGFSAKCAWREETLYLFDTRGGFIWSMKGIEGLGTKLADEEYARALVKGADLSTVPGATRFEEAIRLVGCNRAIDLLTAHGEAH